MAKPPADEGADAAAAVRRASLLERAATKELEETAELEQAEERKATARKAQALGYDDTFGVLVPGLYSSAVATPAQLLVDGAGFEVRSPKPAFVSLQPVR